MPGKEFRVPWSAFLVAAAIWVILCLAAVGCEKRPSDIKGRFEAVYVQKLNRDETLRVAKDTQTGRKCLFYKNDGMAAICPLAEKEVGGRGDEPRTPVPQVSRGFFRTLRVVATAYTAGYESTGKNPGDPGYGVTKSGLPAARGMCAVDPAVIPFGTVLYIPGYGYAVAGDTGSAIKGNKVDLFFPTVEEARAWGVREVEVVLVSRE